MLSSIGGLGGLIIEGEPGIGKSQLVYKILETFGICYYQIPVSMPCAEKKQFLLTAFHAGGVVVIDEINTAAMMEDLLNDLLMGRAPDGRPAEKTGFLLIGTQNPVSMAGRAKLSSALQHRLLTVTLPAYSSEERLAILNYKGVPNDIARRMEEEYSALNAHTHPKLCFRDLLQCAARYLNQNKKRSFSNFSLFPAEKKLKQTDEFSVAEYLVIKNAN